MNYLIIHGYQSTAQRFSQEADIDTPVDPSSLGDRRQVMALIQDGRIQEAIEKINDIDPELLDTNPSLHFSLLRLQLIELIREGFNSNDGNVQPAIDFAMAHLSQRAPNNPQFLADLEKTMALLCFPPDSLIPQLKELMDVKLRKEIANKVNLALMTNQGVQGEPRIHNLINLWSWGEALLSEKVNFPRLERKDLF